jgi:hypothetical protein
MRRPSWVSAKEKNVNTSHPYIGIDIGRYKLFVAVTPEHERLTPKQHPTVELDLKDTDWWKHLLDLIADDAHIAAESTGFHLLAPIARLIEAYRPNATIWQVEGKLTMHIRSSQVSKNAKNDRLDAISLRLIAVMCGQGSPPLGARPYDYEHESVVQALRLHHNTYYRIDRDRVRLINRLKVLARSIAPILDQRIDSYLTAIRFGIVTPQHFRALAALTPKDRRSLSIPSGTRANIMYIANRIPPIDPDETTATAIIDLAAALEKLDQDQSRESGHITALIDTPPLADITHRWRTVYGAKDTWLAALHIATRGQATTITKDEFRAAVGVAPSTAITGEDDSTRLTKKGYRPARAAMHLWTLVCLSPNAQDNAIARYFHASDKRSLGAAKNKLARVLWGVARDPKL